MKSKKQNSSAKVFYWLTKILQFLAWPLAQFAFRFFGKLEIKGKENLKNLPEGIIIASNHYYEMDPILLRIVLPWFGKHAPMYYVARRKNLYSWKGWRSYVYSDLFFNIWGAYPAYKGTKNYAVSLKTFVDIFNMKRTVTIFPEGGIDIPIDELDINKVRGGLGYLAHVTGAPVVPILIEGTLDASWGKLYRFKKKLRIHIGEPQYFEAINPSPNVEKCKNTSKVIWESILDLKNDHE